jgi:hypothetical protein
MGFNSAFKGLIWGLLTIRAALNMLMYYQHFYFSTLNHGKLRKEGPKNIIPKWIFLSLFPCYYIGFYADLLHLQVCLELLCVWTLSVALLFQKAHSFKKIIFFPSSRQRMWKTKKNPGPVTLLYFLILDSRQILETCQSYVQYTIFRTT